MSLDAIHTGQVLPPWSLTAAGRDSEPAPARSAPPGDTDFGTDEGYMFGSDGLTFTDVLDIINPLQHLPVVSTLYRALTGDEISPGSRLVGGAIFGGPTGIAAAIVNDAMVDHTGQDLGQTVLAAILPDDAGPATDTAVALAAGEADVTATEDAPATAPQNTGLSAPPASLTAAAPSDDATLPLFAGTGVSPLLTPASTQPLIDRAPRPQPFAAGPASPAEPDPPARASKPAQIAALPPVARQEAPPAPPPPPAPAKPLLQRQHQADGFAPTPLDPSLIPQAMLSALEKYEQMKRGS